jgi:hypothetical protein
LIFRAAVSLISAYSRVRGFEGL